MILCLVREFLSGRLKVHSDVGGVDVGGCSMEDVCEAVVDESRGGDVVD